MTNKLDLLKIRFDKLQERISIYTFISGMLSIIILAISAYFVGTFLYGSFDITFGKKVIHLGVLVETVLGILTIIIILNILNSYGTFVENTIYRLHRKIKYNVETAKAVWELDSQKYMWIYIDISIEKQNIIINVMDEKSFIKGTIKKKVNEVGYNYLTFDLGEIDKVKTMLEQENPCKSILEKVEQLTETERKQYIIDNMNIGEDVDK